MAKVLPQLVVEGWKQIRIGLGVVEVVEVQPLEREVAHQTRCARILQHPQRLRAQDAGVLQFAGGGDVEQRIVGPLTPEEEREPRGQLEIVEREDCIARRCARAREPRDRETRG